MNKLEVEIPVDKEIDWEASAKQKQIVLRNKQLTYKDVCKKLFTDDYWYSDNFGTISVVETIDAHIYESNNATTKQQLECILAKNKLANVARYLNGEWDTFNNDNHYIIWMNHLTRNLHIEHSTLSSEHSTIVFKSKELAEQAIEILGEETIKVALIPLY